MAEGLRAPWIAVYVETSRKMRASEHRRERLEELFSSVEAAGEVGHPFSMASQHFTLFVCRDPKGWTFDQLWPRLKNWS